MENHQKKSSNQDTMESTTTRENTIEPVTLKNIYEERYCSLSSNLFVCQINILIYRLIDLDHLTNQAFRFRGCLLKLDLQLVKLGEQVLGNIYC